MKLKDCRIGMKVVDKLGNEYEVLEADDTIRPLKLKCTKHVEDCIVEYKMFDNYTAFREIGNEWWIVDSEKNYNKNTGRNVDISLKSIKPLKMYKSFEAGQIVVDKLGNEYEVLEADDTIRPLKLKCIKFVREAKLAPFASFAEVGQIFWIFKSRKAVRKYHFEPEKDILTAKSLKQNSERVEPHAIIQNMLDKGMVVRACVSDKSYDDARSKIGLYAHRIIVYDADSYYPVLTLYTDWKYAVPIDTTTMTEITEVPK